MSPAKLLETGSSGNGDALPALGSGGGNGGGGNGAAAEAVATPGTPTRDGEDGSLASIVTAQRDRFRQRYCEQTYTPLMSLPMPGRESNVVQHLRALQTRPAW